MNPKRKKLKEFALVLRAYCSYSYFMHYISSVFHSILTDAKSVSLNATAAFKAYSNIKANVDAAEKEAKAAKQRASEALDLVSGLNNPFL